MRSIPVWILVGERSQRAWRRGDRESREITCSEIVSCLDLAGGGKLKGSWYLLTSGYPCSRTKPCTDNVACNFFIKK